MRGCLRKIAGTLRGAARRGGGGDSDLYRDKAPRVV